MLDTINLGPDSKGINIIVTLQAVGESNQWEVRWEDQLIGRAWHSDGWRIPPAAYWAEHEASGTYVSGHNFTDVIAELVTIEQNG